MSGSATLATDRFRFATPATRISEARTRPARAGAVASEFVAPAMSPNLAAVAARTASPGGGDASRAPSRKPEAVVEPASFLVVVGVGALAGTLATMLTGRGVLFPTVVAELLLGVVVGPQVLGVEVSEFMEFVSSLGLGMLFFFAGYEIDLRRIAGLPLRLALVGWAMSLAIAYSVGGLLAWAGIVLSLLYTGLRAGHDRDRHADPDPVRQRRTADAYGDVPVGCGCGRRVRPDPAPDADPLLAGGDSQRAILIGFVALAVIVAVAAVRSSSPTLSLFEATLEKSSQLAVRWVVVLVFALALLASELGLDLLLGGFAAGMITRQVLKEREIPGFDSKLTGVAFGFFVPFFFVVSGMQLDVAALFSSIGAIAKMFLFFALFLVVRGTPAMLLYRDALNRSERLALAFFSRPSCRSCSRSRRSRARPGTCIRRPPRRWCAPRCCRHSSSRCSG